MVLQSRAAAELSVYYPIQISGRFPHLAMIGDERNLLPNNYNENGIGALVNWQNRLWAVTYPAHSWWGSDNRGGAYNYLYEIDYSSSFLPMYIHASSNTKTVDGQSLTDASGWGVYNANDKISIGGTFAGRLIHRETNQLIIGPYIIDANRNIRVIPQSLIPGRITAITRDMTDWAHTVDIFTMEQGLYQVNIAVNPPALVKVMHPDGNQALLQTYTKSAPPRPTPAPFVITNCPANPPLVSGSHGKGMYKGQGRLLLADNGITQPSCGRTNSGSLSECPLGKDCSQPASWTQVAGTNFNDVMGPGGLTGPNNDSEPVWAIGWDTKSNLLKMRDSGWYTFRFPKSSHVYEAGSGWNAEWPRINRVNFGSYADIMNMYGLFYQFPNTFSASNTSGIIPLAGHLGIVNDIATTSAYFVLAYNNYPGLYANPVSYGGQNMWPIKQPASNLRFVKDLKSSFGPVSGDGGVWLNETVSTNSPSDPFHFGGYKNRSVHLYQSSGLPVIFTLQTNNSGPATSSVNWTTCQQISVPTGVYKYIVIPDSQPGEWIRFQVAYDPSVLTPPSTIGGVMTYLRYEAMPVAPNPNLTATLANSPSSYIGGLIRPEGYKMQVLPSASSGLYEISQVSLSPANTLAITPKTDDLTRSFILNMLGVSATSTGGNTDTYVNPVGQDKYSWTYDPASVVITDSFGNRYRLPKSASGDFNSLFASQLARGWKQRFIRHTYSEGDTMNVFGTFYELPVSAAGGLRRIRPVTSPNRLIQDFTLWRGMLVMSGINGALSDNQSHTFKSSDNSAALWFGDTDDLWQMGPPSGQGGPWSNTAVSANTWSDPYLMGGYLNKQLFLSHSSASPVTFSLQVDIAGDGNWKTYPTTFTVQPGTTFQYDFPTGYSSQWVRIASNISTTATANFVYTAIPCVSFVNAYINRCAPQSDWDTRNPFCTTTNNTVTFNLPTTGARMMRVAEAPPNLTCTNFDFDSANIGWEVYVPAKSWSFSSSGDKRLCVQFKYDNNINLKCGGRITVNTPLTLPTATVPPPTLISTPTSIPPTLVPTNTSAPIIYNCRRCSYIDGCEMTTFTSNSADCQTPLASSTITRTADCNCPQITNGYNTLCQTSCVTPTPVPPVCQSWTNFNVNGCTYTGWTSVPKSASCYINQGTSIIYLSISNATQMRFTNVSNSLTCTNLSGVSGLSWSSWENYTGTKSWSFPVVGDNKVCGEFKNGVSSSAYCGAIITRTR